MLHHVVYIKIALVLINFNSYGNCQNSKLVSIVENIYNDVNKNIKLSHSDETKSPLLIDGLKAAVNFGDELCSIVKLTVPEKMRPNISDISFVLMTHDKNYTYPVTDAAAIVRNSAFNSSWPTVLFSTGWQTSMSSISDAIAGMSEAYLCRGNTNFIIVNYGSFLDLFYPWSALNTVDIGLYTGIGLTNLLSVYNIENIHLIGHSLGAHIQGMAARFFTKTTSQIIPRITGLDPAKPCFINDKKLVGLRATDASFVDVIHSDPGIIGIDSPVGDADFYPNGRSNPIQPGCHSFGCTHSRSYEYYAETVYPGNENGFMSTICSSLRMLDFGFCEGERYPMGIACPTTLKGTLFLTTHSKAPFGLNSLPLTDIRCSSGNPNNTDIIL